MTGKSRKILLFASLLILIMLSLLNLHLVYAQATPNDIEATGSISGTVTDEANTPLAGIGVYLYRNNLFYSEVASTLTDNAGNYQFRYLKTDSYLIFFADQTRVIGKSYQNKTPVSVAGNSVTVNNTEMEYAGAISGTVTSTYGYSIESLSATVHRGSEYISESAYKLIYEAGSDVVHYQILGLKAGEYQLGMSTSIAGQRVEEYYNDALSQNSWTIIPVQPKVVTTGIDFVIDTNHETGTISGQVSISGTQSLPGFNVTLYKLLPSSDEWQSIRYADTNDSGGYRFLILEPGLYKVRFSDDAKNYIDTYYGNATTIETARIVSVTVGADIKNISVQMKPAGQISGKITMANGHAPDSSSVKLYSSADGYKSAVRETHVYYSEFTFRGLPEGTYRLLTAAEYEDAAYTEYYDGSVTPEGAQPITITESNLITGVAVVLGRTPIYGMASGYIQDKSGVPLTEFKVTAYRNIEGVWQEAQTDRTDSAGKYTLIALNPGSYRICVTDPDKLFADKCYVDSDFDNAQPVEIAAGEVLTNVNIATNKTGVIAGTLWLMPDSHFSDGQILVYQQDGVYWRQIDSLAISFYPLANNHLDYEVGGLQTGIYRVKAHVESNYYDDPDFDRYFGGSTTISNATDITVTYGQETPGIDFILGQDINTAGIEGTVLSNNVAIEGIAVEIYQKPYPYFDEWTRWVSVISDKNGRYKLDGLPAGQYRLAFVDPKGQHTTIYYGAVPPYPEYELGIKDAQTIDLAQGEWITDIDVDMFTGYQAPALYKRVYLPIVAR